MQQAASEQKQRGNESTFTNFYFASNTYAIYGKLKLVQNLMPAKRLTGQRTDYTANKRVGSRAPQQERRERGGHASRQNKLTTLSVCECLRELTIL